MAQIESYVEPRRLYRYRSPEDLDREMEAIEGAYLYCAAYDDLNDPMEGLFSSSSSLRESANYRARRNAIRNTKADIGICSFSEVYNHELMWAHYAKQFRGICIAYNLKRLLKGLAPNVSFVRMYYNEEVPVVGNTNRDSTEIAKMVLSYKSYRWLYEREWRMFATQGRVSYGQLNCVTQVYLGSQMRLEDRERVQRALREPKIKVSGMSIEKYSITFKSFDPSSP